MEDRRKEQGVYKAVLVAMTCFIAVSSLNVIHTSNRYSFVHDRVQVYTPWRIYGHVL